MTNSPHTTRAERMHDLLMIALAPTYISLVDESAQHRGHKGVREHAQNQTSSVHSNADETHFSLEITSTVLNGLSRVKQHQLIYASVADEFKTGLHSLRINVVLPIH